MEGLARGPKSSFRKIMLGHTLRTPIGNGWKRNLTSVVGWLNCKLHKVKYSLCHLL